MIYSTKHGFVFIKGRKVAGTSLEIALSARCGPDDIITPITFEDELMRYEQYGALPRNFAIDPEKECAYLDNIRSGTKASFSRKNCKFWNHMPASDICELLGQHTFRKVLKFVIERHPYEKVVSQAFWKHSRAKDLKSFFRGARTF